MEKITLKAYAKINLCLDVTGRLENGYHLVRMIMQTVDLYDVLSFRKTEGDIIVTTDCAELPCDENNLIYRAIRLIQDTCKVTGGVEVSLEKRIPIAAGMAGGSADCAATLKAMNLLYDLGLSTEELMKLGLSLGADVPYCILGGTALSEGIGELLTPLPAPPEAILLIAKPGIGVSTKYVYEALDSREILEHPDVDGMLNAIGSSDLAGIVSGLGNVLQTVTEQEYPIISRIKEVMLENGAAGALMSGSGPTVFGIFESRESAAKAQGILMEGQLAEQSFVTGFFREASEV